MEKLNFEIGKTSIPGIRICEFCGDEFFAHHGLQRYCPEKYGRVNHCKNEQKKLVNERKLADLVQDVANAVERIELPKNQLEINIDILSEMIGRNESDIVTSNQLDNMGYNIWVFTSKRINESNGLVEILVGQFILEWIGDTNVEQTFKLSKI